MIGIDTNVVVRYLTQDDPKQARMAATLLETECTVERPGYLNDIVLCEVVWVLEDAYGYTRLQIAPVLERLIRTSQLRVADAGSAWRAVAAYRKGFDFADALLGDVNQRAGCSETVSFDQRAAKLPGFRLLKTKA